MRGHNVVMLSGNIGGNIVNGKTRDDRPAFSFGVASQNEKKRTTWVRVNSYDKLAEYCATTADKGLYVSVIGELMNRDGKYGELTEVRAHQVIFHTRNNKDDRADDNSEDYVSDESTWAEDTKE